MSQRVLLIALFLGGSGMRIQLVGLGPLVPIIQADLGIPHAVAGLLTTIPVLCMAAAAIPASTIAARVSPRVGVAGSLAVLTIAGLARIVVPEPLWVLALTLPIGLAIGFGGAFLPLVAKRHLPLLPAQATGAYVAGFVLGSSFASAVATPLALLFDSWQAALAVLALVTLPILPLWLIGTPREEVFRSVGRRPAMPWRRPVAWLLVAPFGLQSMLFFGLVAWLPALYVELGYGNATGGFLLSILVTVGLPATLAMGWLGDRYLSRRFYLVLASVLSFVALVGLLVAPDLAVLWAISGGIGLGILFPVSLTLPLDVSNDPAEAGRYVGMVLTVGYVIAGLTPALLGGLRDVIGSFAGSLWVLVAASLVLLGVTTLISPTRLRAERGRRDPEADAA